MIKFKRKKPFNFICSFFYRFNKFLVFCPRVRFKIYCNLEWIFNRLAGETSHELYKNALHINRVGWLDFLKIKLKKNKTVIDVGCSSGINTMFISKLCKEVVGIDHNSNYINYAKKYYAGKNIKFIESDVFDYLNKNKKKRFDIAVCSHIIEHLNYPKSFLKKLGKCVKFIYIEVPDFESSYLNLIRKDQSIKLNYSDDDHIYEFDRLYLKKLLASCNLVIENEEYRFGVIRLWVKNKYF